MIRYTQRKKPKNHRCADIKNGNPGSSLWFQWLGLCSFHYRRRGFHPWSGNCDPESLVTPPKNEKPELKPTSQPKADGSPLHPLSRRSTVSILEDGILEFDFILYFFVFSGSFLVLMEKKKPLIEVLLF